jgi:hypothetical protein
LLPSSLFLKTVLELSARGDTLGNSGDALIDRESIIHSDPFLLLVKPASQPARIDAQPPKPQFDITHCSDWIK